LLGRLFDALEAREFPRLLRRLPLLLGLIAALPGLWQRFWLHWYFVNNDHNVAGICRRFAPQIGTTDTVLAWGWHAWSVYEHCHRLAPGPVYKTIGTVTTLNTNTCNRGYGRLKLREGEVTKRFMSDLERRPPALILWSTYHYDMGGDPLDDWSELSTFLEQRYTMVRVEKQLIAYLRNDRMKAAEGL